MPINRLWDEAAIIRQRINDLMGTEATLIKLAIVDVLAGENTLSEALENLNE